MLIRVKIPDRAARPGRFSLRRSLADHRLRGLLATLVVRRS
jgi:hypothetical protein